MIVEIVIFGTAAIIIGVVFFAGYAIQKAAYIEEQRMKKEERGA